VSPYVSICISIGSCALHDTVDRCWLVYLPYLVSMVSVIHMESISCPEGQHKQKRFQFIQQLDQHPRYFENKTLIHMRIESHYPQIYIET